MKNYILLYIFRVGRKRSYCEFSLVSLTICSDYLRTDLIDDKKISSAWKEKVNAGYNIALFATCYFNIISPGIVLTNILGDLESDKPIAGGLTAKQVLYIWDFPNWIL